MATFNKGAASAAMPVITDSALDETLADLEVQAKLAFRNM